MAQNALTETSATFRWKPALPLRRIAHKLAPLGFSALRVSASNVILISTEGSHLGSAPSSYIKIQLTPDSVRLAYTGSTSPQLRKLEACSLLLEVLSLSGSGTYLSDDLASLFRSSFAFASELLTDDYRLALARNASLLEENRKAK